MDDLRAYYLRRRMRRRLTWFLRNRSPWRAQLVLALRGLGPQIPIYLFGGAVRDLAVFGRFANPIDIDLVVDNVSIEDLETCLHPFVDRKTRLGGLKLLIAGTAVDIWPLHETWAFRMQHIECPAFSRLPVTTFLNVEAVAAELTRDCLGVGRVYSKGFFEGIASKRVEINNFRNPSPEKAITRSLALAGKMGFSVGPVLARHAADFLGDCLRRARTENTLLTSQSELS